MYNLSSISKLLLRLACCLLIFCSVSCHGNQNAKKAEKIYYIHAEDPKDQLSVKMASHLSRHLQSRCKSNLLTEHKTDDCFEVIVKTGDFGYDYKVEQRPGFCKMTARDEKTTIWLIYQFMKREGVKDDAIEVRDLPPCIFPRGDTTATFPFEYRDVYSPSNQNPDITILLCLNNVENDWGLWGHQMNKVLGGNGEKSYGSANMDQELFAQVNGITKQSQLCFSSEKLYELTVKYIKDKYGDGVIHPERFMIAPNDNSFVCTCRKCQSAGNTSTNATPTVTRFIERLAADFPNHSFFTVGYSTTSQIPDHKLPDNVGVMLAAVDYTRAYQNSESAAAQNFFNKIEQWKSITKKVYVWDYICNFDDYLSPFPILMVMKDRIQQYAERGVKGVFLNGSGYFYASMQEAYCFVLSQLMINPNLDPLRLLHDYMYDAVPHLADMSFAALESAERHMESSHLPLPMYAGMDEISRTYIRPDNFVAFYKFSVKHSTENIDMTPREKAIYQKLRQLYSYTYMELCRLGGVNGKYSFAVKNEDGSYSADPLFLRALNNLRDVISEKELYYLTNNDNARMDHMDRVNEAGVYLGDYQRECDIWINKGVWSQNMLLGIPLKVYSHGWEAEEDKLTDGVLGISQNYHWGWILYFQEKLVMKIPADKVQEANEIAMGFLNFERHKMSPPVSVEIWVDGELKTTVKQEQLSEFFDEGQLVVFRSKVDFKGAQDIELHFNPSEKTKFLTMDEIIIRKI